MELFAHPADYFHQGDEVGKPIDFFTPVVSAGKRHTAFEELRTASRFSPALALLRELMHYFVDVDGNFIQQFQSTGFDARLWELYLYATFTELGYGFRRSSAAPDFDCFSPVAEFVAEATTLGTSPSTPPLSSDTHREYVEEYLPIRFAGALTGKLQKEYWKHSHVQGRPLIFGIQDFHAPGSMAWSQTSLVEYLYGLRQVRTNGEVKSVKIATHNWKGKAIQSDFFNQPGAENVSAVIANPAGTISKFNRMGYLTGFGDRGLIMRRFGLAFQSDNEATPFEHDVRTDGQSET